MEVIILDLREGGGGYEIWSYLLNQRIITVDQVSKERKNQYMYQYTCINIYELIFLFYQYQHFNVVCLLFIHKIIGSTHTVIRFSDKNQLSMINTGIPFPCYFNERRFRSHSNMEVLTNYLQN